MKGIQPAILIPITSLALGNLSYVVSRRRFLADKDIRKHAIGERELLNFNLTSEGQKELIPFRTRIKAEIHRNVYYGLNTQFESVLQVGILSTAAFSLSASSILAGIFMIH